MGRRPSGINCHLIDDLVAIRLLGALTLAEQHLVKSQPTERGRDLLKQVRVQLIETARPLLDSMMLQVTSVNIVSLHHDISTTTGRNADDELPGLFRLPIADTFCSVLRRANSRRHQ